MKLHAHVGLDGNLVGLVAAPEGAPPLMLTPSPGAKVSEIQGCDIEGDGHVAAGLEAAGGERLEDQVDGLGVVAEPRAVAPLVPHELRAGASLGLQEGPEGPVDRGGPLQGVCGHAARIAKLAADAMAACMGRAASVPDRPSSSRA